MNILKTKKRRQLIYLRNYMSIEIVHMLKLEHFSIKEKKRIKHILKRTYLIDYFLDSKIKKMMVRKRKGFFNKR